MTAPEPTPTAEHIDAVARHLPYIVPWERLTEGSRNDYRRKARRIMDDPSVHEALAANLPADVMLAALVRAGVLTPEDAPIYRGAEHHHWQQRWDGEHTHEGRRHVTRWEVAP